MATTAVPVLPTTAHTSNIALRFHRLRPLLPYALIALFVAAFWLPFGLKTTGLMEEWIAFNSYERQTPGERDETIRLVTLSGTQRLRPLQFAPSAIGHLLTPDSFVGLNLVHAAVIILKAWGFYTFAWVLFRRAVLPAFLGALLFAIFPSDEAWFTFRAMAIHPAVGFWLWAAAFLLLYWQRPRLGTLLLMWGSLLISLLIYEVGYLLTVAAPLLLFCFPPVKRRRFIRVTLLWSLPAIATFIYVAFSLAEGGNTYQGWMLQRGGVTQPTFWLEVAASIGRAFAQNYALGWRDVIATLPRDGGLLLLGLSLGVVVFFASLRLLPTTDDRALSASGRTLLGWAAVGAVILLLGFLPFTITPARWALFRVFCYSVAGATISFTAFIWLISLRLNPRVPRAVFATLMSLLIALASVWALNQHAYYVGLSQQQQALLENIIQSVPQPQSGAVVAVVDETGRYWNNNSLGASYLLQTATQYIAQDYNRQLALCSFDPDAGAFRTLPELQERCTFTPAGLSITRTNSTGEAMETVEYAADDLIVLRYTDAGATVLDSLPEAYTDGQAISGYNPRALFDPAAALPPRYDTLLSP